MAAHPVQERTIRDAVEHTLMPSEATERDDALHGQLRCVVVTPERAVLERVVEMVVLPMFDGEFGVLPGHSPVMGRLGAGELRLKTAAGVERWFVEAGFVQVRANVVSVLTAKAVPAKDVSAAAAEQARGQAEALPSSNALERAAKAKARDRALGMKKTAGRNGDGLHAASPSGHG